MPTNNVSKSDFWNNCYDKQNTGWDLGGITPVFKQWCDNLDKKSKICVPGSGNGYDALYFSKKGHKVLAVDFALEPIKRIEAEAKKNNLSIDTLMCDFFSLDQKYYNSFDYIIEYTFFCAISPNRRNEYRDTMHKLLSKSGKLVGLFFPLNKNKAEGGPPFGVDLDEMISNFSEKFILSSSLKHPLSIKPRFNNEQYLEFSKK
tara:strand:- start:143 stop:751 length:609 start_codon:yes stop_codon:yes gene_type:complete